MNRYPMQQQAKQLEAQGRFGDTVLVHMNPVEVQGLASLSPTGKLTRNPQTGQPEAFLPVLIPMLASWGSSAALGGSIAAGLGTSAAMGSAIAGGLGSAVATTALTGDLKRGAVAGLMGAGIGAAGAAGAGGAEAAAAGADAAAQTTQAAADIAANTPLNTGLDLANAGNASAPGITGLGQDGLVSGMNAAPKFNPVMPKDAPISRMTGPEITGPGVTTSGLGKPPFAQSAAPGTPMAAPPSAGGEGIMSGFGSRLGQSGKNILGNMTKPQYLMPTGTAYGQLAQMNQTADMEDYISRRQADKAKKKEKSRSLLRDIYGGYAGGGVVRYGTGGPTTMPPVGSDEWIEWWQSQYPYLGDPTGPTSVYGNQGGDPRANNPIALQRRQHWFDPELQDSPYQTFAPPSDYMPGFNPEFAYFQQKGVEDPFVPQYSSSPYTQGSSVINRFMNQTNAQPVSYFPQQGSGVGAMFGGRPRATPYVGPRGSGKGGGGGSGKGGGQQPPAGGQQPPAGGQQPPAGGGNFAASQPNPQMNVPRNNIMDTIISNWAGRRRVHQKADGGQMPQVAKTPAGEVPITPGGIAEVPNNIAQPANQSPNEPSAREIEMVAMAIAGAAGDKGQQIIDMFIRRYGPEVFKQLREIILQTIQPGAQTEGMVKGPGGGMDDQVPGMIGAQQPVAVSPGEYIVPADVVSGIGDGSSDAGAEELDRMSQDIRMARGGSAEQPPAIDARRYLPR